MMFNIRCIFLYRELHNRKLVHNFFFHSVYNCLTSHLQEDNMTYEYPNMPPVNFKYVQQQNTIDYGVYVMPAPQQY